jgi:hypothetical protein
VKREGRRGKENEKMESKKMKKVQNRVEIWKRGTI